MVFGDNVRARKAARALPRTPTQRGRGRRRRGKQTTRQHTLTPSHTPPSHNPQHSTTRQHAPPHIKSGQRTGDTTRPSTPHNHHRYSTMTQPCHKDTTLNQQCCDSKHNTYDARQRRCPPPLFYHTPHTTGRHTPSTSCRPRHAPPHFPIRNRHDSTQRGRGEQDDTRTTRQCEGNRTIRRCRTQSSRQGATHTPPAIQRDH